MKLKYGVEYVDNTWSTDNTFASWSQDSDIDGDIIQFVTSTNKNCKRVVNIWSEIGSEESRAYVPETIDVSSFNIYFPNHSVETYTNNNLYIVEFTTYINGDRIILGSFLIDRRDAKAYSGIKIIAGERYYEYVNILVPDPWHIVYSDEWADFRREVCGEPENINNTGSLVNIEMHPVVKDGNEYREHSDFIGGSNSILISDNSNDYLAPQLSIEPNADGIPSLYLSFNYNSVYKDDESLGSPEERLRKYIEDTYQLQQPIDAKTSVILHDKDSVYNYYMLTGTADAFIDLASGSTITIPFNSWTAQDGGTTVNYWKDGLMFTAFFTLYNEDEPAISLTSNSIPVTQETFAKLITRQNGVPGKVDLEASGALDLTINNEKMTEINIVNKIEKKIVNIQRPNEHKGGIARPVFFKVHEDGQTIQVHPSVTENIGINLQKYKNSVKLFTMKIEGFEFPEIGRIGANVVFKVNAGTLPDTLTSGLYYILDDNKELVIFGNYTL